ncbi:MAG: hypothetical protein EZS28_052392 [Streblomastix strix]|uniref:Uncharacterized protein n=1 Tax=Streblomastix strix TaxID=222440 RepID=A0A5J4SAE2_9EUKA|nr:MAG: hypothetical protein EZS28_052392 [Streblomastix strix]
MLRREYASHINGSEAQKLWLGAATWIHLPFFSVEQRRRKAFQTAVTGQRTELQCGRPSHFQLVQPMENIYFSTHVACRIPQEDPPTA